MFARGSRVWYTVKKALLTGAEQNNATTLEQGSGI